MRYPEIAASIKEARRRKRWSQERAAQEIGTSRFHWIRWEQGLHRPTGDLAKNLIERLGIPVELLGEDEDEEEAALATVLSRAVSEVVRRQISRHAAEARTRLAEGIVREELARRGADVADPDEFSRSDDDRMVSA